MAGAIVAPEAYSVRDNGPSVILQIGNVEQPMTWEIAIRMAARLRVELRNAREYRFEPRLLPEREEEREAKVRKAVHVGDLLFWEGQYRIRAEGSDVVLRIGNGTLTMVPSVASNIAKWLANSGEIVRARIAPEVRLSVSIAQLTDGNRKEREADRRRDGTASFK